MKSGAIGKVYNTGEIIVSEGDAADRMYVIQEGTVEVIQTVDRRSIHVTFLKEGDFFGETGLFDNKARPVSVRAMGAVRILTIDKKNFLRRIHEDPSFAFNIIKNLSHRISMMYANHSTIKAKDRRNWDTRPKSMDRPEPDNNGS